MRSDLTISGGWTQFVLRGLARAGLDMRAVCMACGVPYAALDDPDTRVPRDASGLVWREAARRSADPYLGLHAGENVPPSINNVPAHLILSSESLEAGFRRVLPFQPLIGHGDVLSLERRGDDFALCFEPIDGDLPVTRHEVEFMMVVVARFAALVQRRGFRPSEVRFRHALVGDGREHERVFRCPARFGARENALLVAAEMMATPSPHHSPEIVRVLEAVASEQIARLAEPSFAGQVRSLVRARLGVSSCDVAAIAGAMHVSLRTLQRRLGDERTHFSDVLDLARRDLALDLVAGGEAVATIARRLGFADARAFARAFQRWTGTTPTGHRRSATPASTPPAPCAAADRPPTDARVARPRVRRDGGRPG